MWAHPPVLWEVQAMNTCASRISVIVVQFLILIIRKLPSPYVPQLPPECENITDSADTEEEENQEPHETNETENPGEQPISSS